MTAKFKVRLKTFWAMVRNSILTQEEKINLDKDLEITELDKAPEHANGKSTPGVDGFTHGFIRKFWHIYRQPLFTCASTALENQTLPESFLTPPIKLIPKKVISKKLVIGGQ